MESIEQKITRHLISGRELKWFEVLHIQGVKMPDLYNLKAKITYFNNDIIFFNVFLTMKGIYLLDGTIYMYLEHSLCFIKKIKS